MAQRTPPRKREDTGGQGGGVAPAGVGLEWVIAMTLGITGIIVALIIADIIGA
ncbi:MAG TPA: hypothetical protein VFZ12_03640 [Dehalococcoidia bacterium]|jgi:hypothetical protein|nr:hypothetical protein [Candidatus Polarisedimenticolia bacterium]HEX5939430.1 hypothetical protein [Dehalococcoidia bacterium]